MTQHTETNSAMPPLSEIPPSSTIASRKRVKKMGNTSGESINIERDRRSKMTQMFNQLRTTVPGVSPQATREVIINETISYIKELEMKKQRLEELKESMNLKRVQGGSMVACSSNNNNCSITVTVSSNVAFFGIQSMPRPSLITIVLKVFCKHQAEVLAANVSVNDGKLILAITALVQNGVIENIKREIMSL